MRFSPEKSASCPEPNLTTTIVESHEPDFGSEDDESLDAILLDDNELVLQESPKRPKIEGDKFAAHLNLEHFRPAEIQVTVLEDSSGRSSKRTLEVRARHQAGHLEHNESTGDEYECLEYVKRLSLPVGVTPDDLRCRLDSRTGHLVIEAPLGSTTEEPEIQLLNHRRLIPVEIQDQKPQPQHNLNSDLIIID